jgi:hypothetical protein
MLAERPWRIEPLSGPPSPGVDDVALQDFELELRRCDRRQEKLLQFMVVRII